MFEPVSKLPYVRLNPIAQAIVVTPVPHVVVDAWKERAAALLSDGSAAERRDVVRDLLANPQIRAIVFDGRCACRDTYDDLWLIDGTPDGWRIDREHMTLVRRFVDLYDDDFGHRLPQQPFWPVRIKYLD